MITGCSTVNNQQKAKENLSDVNKEVVNLKQENNLGYQKVDRPFFGAYLNNAKKDPEFLSKEIDFSSAPTDLNSLAGKLSVVLNMPVRMSMDLPFGNTEIPSLSINENITQTLALPPLGMNTSTLSGPLIKPAYLSNPIRYKGTIKGLLDMLASSTRTAWRYDSVSGLTFSRYQTEVFRLDSLAGEYSQDAVVAASGESTGGDGKTSGTSGKSSINSAFNSKSDMWDSLKKTLASMKSEKGQFSVNMVTGAVTVTDTYEVLEQVRNYINSENDALSKQVMLDVQVYLVSNNDTDQFNLNMALNQLGLSQKLSVTVNNDPINGAGSLGFGIIRDAGNLSITSVLNALSKSVKVSKVTSASLLTQNGQPAPIQVADELSYLAKVSSTMAGTTGATQTSLEPGKVTSGFSLNVLPRIMTNGDILMQVAMDLSSLTSLKKDSAQLDANGNPTGNAITTPEVARRNTLQRVIVGSGDILILSGFEQSSNSLTKTGMGDVDFYGMGGGRSSTIQKDTLLVIAKPVVLKSKSNSYR